MIRLPMMLRNAEPPATPPAPADPPAPTPTPAPAAAIVGAAPDLAAELAAERARAKAAEIKAAEVEDRFNTYKKSVETPKAKKIGVGWFEEE